MTKQAPMRLWYTAPAPTDCDGDRAYQKTRNPLAGWEKWSLPLGNSYFGASVFGRIAVERINITENSVSNPEESSASDSVVESSSSSAGNIELPEDKFH